MFETLERADWHETLCSLEYLNAELIALNLIESQKQVIQHALKIYPENGALYLKLAEVLFKNSETVPAHHVASGDIVENDFGINSVLHIDSDESMQTLVK